jgi:hypothetical protein
VGLTPGEAHESAIKEAETDAMKRALSTFGNPFGLALYDKEQQNVRGRRKKQQKSAPNGKDRPITWLVLSSEGEYLSSHEDPVDYCKAMRQLLEAISTRQRLRSFWQRNLVTLAMLRWNLPDLKTEKGEHYADILTNLYKQQMRLVWEEAKANQRRASKLAIEGGEANAQRQKVQKQGHHIGAIRTQETEQLSSAPETSLEGRNDSRSPKVEHSQTNERQNPSEGRLEQGGHRNGDAAEPSSAIDADRIRTQKAESRNNGGAMSLPAVLTRLACRSARRGGSEIRNIFAMSPHNPASSVGALPDMLITCALRSLGPWGARSVTSGLCPFAQLITERCMALATRNSGGKRRGLIRLCLPFGSGGTRDTVVLSTQTE